MSREISITPHTVGAVSNRTGAYGNHRQLRHRIGATYALKRLT